MSEEVKENEQGFKEKKPETLLGVFKGMMRKRAKRAKRAKAKRRRSRKAVKLSKGDLLKRYYESRNKHWLYGAVSFVMTALFYMSFTSPEFVIIIAKGIKGGGTEGFSSAVGAGIWAGVGLLFSITITLLIMHSHTTEKSGFKIIAYVLLILLGVTFNVFTETASTMDRVDERVVVKSQNSAISKALVGSIGGSSGSSGKAYTKAMNDYADALSTKKIYCKSGKDYSKKLCKKWTMRTDEYQIAMGLHAKNAKSEKAETVRLAKEASHNEEYAQMVIKLMMKKTDLSFLEATGLISLFIIGTFEVLGIMIGGEYMRYRDMLTVYGIDLHGNKAVRYLRKDIKRRKKQDKENSNYAIYRANQKLKEMQNSQVVRAELKRIGEKISEISGVQGAVYAGHHTVASASSNGAVASGGVKMGFVDTDARSEVGVMPDVQPVSNIYDDVSLDFEGYSLGQLQRRRQEYKRIGGDNPTCPACNMTFPRRTWQDVFCKAEHRAEFNNQIRRLTRSGS